MEQEGLMWDRCQLTDEELHDLFTFVEDRVKEEGLKSEDEF